MDITPVLSASFQLIQGYGDSGFTIADRKYDGAVLVLPELTQPLAAQGFSSLSASDFLPLYSAKPAAEVLLIGCGKAQRLLPIPLRNELRRHGIAADAMDTGAACRTFNVLLAEGRRVAALLFPYR